MADQIHRYNDPTLTPLQFLKAVYSDPSVPMHLRMLAAERAAPYDSGNQFREPWPGECRVTIVIKGIQDQVSVSVDHDHADQGPPLVGHA